MVSEKFYLVSVPMKVEQFFHIRAASKKEAIQKAKAGPTEETRFRNPFDPEEKEPDFEYAGISEHGDFYWSAAKAEEQ